MSRITVLIITATMLLTAEVIALAPPGDCTKELHRAMQDRVDAVCKGEPMRCLMTQTCDQLRLNWYRMQDCARARFDINQRCFRGGDQGHIDQLQAIINGKEKCERFLAAKNCPKVCP
jgi:Novel toxin 16